MAPKCNHCGSDMPDDELFCRECGTPIQEITQSPEVFSGAALTPNIENMDADGDNITELTEDVNIEDILNTVKTEPENAESAEEKKPKIVFTRKHWIISGVIAAALALVVLLWTPITVFLFPKLALTNAFINTGKDLENRFETTPFAVMAAAYDGSGQNTIRLAADYHDEYLGTITASGTVQTDTVDRQATASVGIEAFNRPFYINAFMDADKMALNCQQFTDNRYYGIVYDTFADDVRDNQILYNFLGEDRLTQIDGYLKLIDSIMSPDQTQAGEGTDNPANSTAKEILKSHILALDPTVGVDTIQLDGTNRRCYTISFTMSEAEFGKLLEDIIDVTADNAALEHVYVAENAGSGNESWGNIMGSARSYAQDLQSNGQGHVTFVFYLYNNRVVHAELDYTSAGIGMDGNCTAAVTLGEDASSSDLIFTMDAELAGESYGIDARLNTALEDTTIREALGLSLEVNGVTTNYVIDYTWNSDNGALWLSGGVTTATQAPITFQMNGNLTALDSGFQVSLPEFGSYLAAAHAAKKGSEPMDVNCTLSLTVTAGCQIEQPEFIDLMSMSGFQLYELISGLIK